MDILTFTGSISDIAWYIGFLILIPIAISLTVKYRALQVTRLKECAETAVGENSRDETEGISSYEAFLIGLGERVGIGNIVSVAAAITIGGPGAIFWMWVFAILVAILSFAETTLSQIYKSKREDGIYVGGPAYNAAKAFGNESLGKKLAILYVVLVLVIAFTVSSTFTEQLFNIGSLGTRKIFVAITFTLILIFILVKGMKFIAKASRYVVPLMAILWILLCAIVLIANWRNLGHAFEMIFHYAFVIPEGIDQYGFLSIRGVWEGLRGPIGALIGTVMITGLRRGIFSNDAGLGTIAIASSVADVKHPAQQGIVQCFGVFIDTIVICTCTALVILSFGDFADILGLNLENAPLVSEIIGRSLSIGELSNIIVSVFMFVFTITTLMSLMNMMESTVYMFGKDPKNYRNAKILMVIAVFVSCFSTAAIAINVCDIMMAVCAIVNITIVFRLRKQITETYRDYRKQKKEGIENPEFCADTLSDPSGVTEWK